ncbi:YutD family protein [Gemella palaticanis]|uniref:YutD family protein n=1 Tax=Gemelliphila palaticanis TaxID=81950 RepID=A0ABX2T0C1_9BACL|nr:YutD family protein [Gemella palaticanis]NYS46645.1 YutD family protein [Gemella palaticanis]
MAHKNLIFETEHGIFELLFNYKDAFEKELFIDKYVNILDDKQFILGDIAYDKLRLSGFILSKDTNNPKNINNLEDYILEFCNLGCPFFVLKKLNKKSKSKIEEDKVKMQENGSKSNPGDGIN